TRFRRWSVFTASGLIAKKRPTDPCVPTLGNLRERETASISLRPGSHRQINHTLQILARSPSRRLHRHPMHHRHNIPRQIPRISPSRQIPINFRAFKSLPQRGLARSPPRNQLFAYWVSLISASQRPLHHQASLRILRARKQVRRPHHQPFRHGPRRRLLQRFNRVARHLSVIPVQRLPKQCFLVPKRSINARPVNPHRRRQIRKRRPLVPLPPEYPQRRLQRLLWIETQRPPEVRRGWP